MASDNQLAQKDAARAASIQNSDSIPYNQGGSPASIDTELSAAANGRLRPTNPRMQMDEGMHKDDNGKWQYDNK